MGLKPNPVPMAERIAELERTLEVGGVDYYRFPQDLARRLLKAYRALEDYKHCRHGQLKCFCTKKARKALGVE